MPDRGDENAIHETYLQQLVSLRCRLLWVRREMEAIEERERNICLDIARAKRMLYEHGWKG